jgi:peptide/nickel transport system substrate-binding protein
VKDSARFNRVWLAAALAAIVSACDGGAGGAPAQTEPARTASPRSATENQINPLPRDRVQDGGTLTWPLDQIPTNFNYLHLDGSLFDNATVISGLLPSMFLFDASATPTFNPDYLASDPVLAVEPKQVVKYVINPKAAWDDGTPITWADFRSQWESNNGKNKEYQISSSNGYSEIENVERGADDREVVVTFAQHYADWQGLFSPLYPASMTGDPKVFNEGWKERPVLTAGPFVFDSLDLTSKTITLVRNEKWWGNRAKLDRIVFRALELPAQIDALANGEIDIMDIGPDANVYNRAKSIEGVQIRVAAGPNFRHLTINGTSANLQDVNVRKALAMGIDRASITRALLGPLGITPAPLGNHVFMANQAGYRDNSGEVGSYNPERAKQLLDEAGWKLDGDVRMKDGRPLEISIVIPGGVASSRQESELMQNMLGRIGVTLKINVVPVSDFFDKYVNVGQFDFTVFSWIGTPFPISSGKSIYAKPVVNSAGGLDIQQNYARVGSDEIDALYSEATSELDRATAIEIANRIDGLIWQEVHSLTMYQRPELWACKTGLANIGAFGFAAAVYEDIGWAKP